MDTTRQASEGEASQDETVLPCLQSDAHDLRAEQHNASLEVCCVCGDWSDWYNNTDSIILCSNERCQAGLDALGESTAAAVHTFCLDPPEKKILPHLQGKYVKTESVNSQRSGIKDSHGGSSEAWSDSSPGCTLSEVGKDGRCSASPTTAAKARASTCAPEKVQRCNPFSAVKRRQSFQRHQPGNPTAWRALSAERGRRPPGRSGQAVRGAGGQAPHPEAEALPVRGVLVQAVRRNVTPVVPAHRAAAGPSSGAGGGAASAAQEERPLWEGSLSVGLDSGDIVLPLQAHPILAHEEQSAEAVQSLGDDSRLRA
eukprot:CAMPEP_0177605390 /NCGR_PEP_ID=MMETSP0419_2-20121207/16674_1 /TAXON_ID=582737 /ORGANISM="Tetraselmis sp., Strain GSL018" /LENGTH=312 /DNA_ID=CAMNT_0019099533 /DNA_START=485 /DNA_END=1421 /DNA_ORIENTATION=+